MLLAPLAHSESSCKLMNVKLSRKSQTVTKNAAVDCDVHSKISSFKKLGLTAMSCQGYLHLKKTNYGWLQCPIKDIFIKKTNKNLGWLQCHIKNIFIKKLGLIAMTYQRYLHKTDKKVKDSFPRFRHIGYMALDVCFYRPISTRCVMQSVPCQSLLLSRTLCPKAGWSWKIFRKLHC